METNFDVVVIGGGASGMMSAIFASRKGKKTLILDHNEKLGKKLYITGKGKCNLTNNSSVETHLENIMHNSKFMYSALNAFTPQDTMAFFEENGKEKVISALMRKGFNYGDIKAAFYELENE